MPSLIVWPIKKQRYRLRSSPVFAKDLSLECRALADDALNPAGARQLAGAVIGSDQVAVKVVAGGQVVLGVAVARVALDDRQQVVEVPTVVLDPSGRSDRPRPKCASPGSGESRPPGDY